MWKRRSRGFTLLEVLAAVAVLALVYTALAQAAMQGLAHEGDASRRLRASLLADAALAEVEAMVAAHAPLTVGLLEDEAEEFAIQVEVRPFDLGGLALQAGEASAALLGKAQGLEGANPAGPAFQLLTGQAGAPSPLLEIEIRVAWVEGGFEQEVTRTTFAADPVTVAAALEGLAPAEGADSAEPEDEPDEAEAPPPDDGSGGEIPEAEMP